MKLQYHFSPVTVATFSYFGSQTVADQNANISSQTVYNFDPTSAFGPNSPTTTPPAPYTGSLAPGPQVITNFFPGQETEYNNEPIFQGEIRSTLGKDNIIVRGYTASIHRLGFQGGDDPTIPITENLALYGTAYGFDNSGNPIPLQTFNGQAEPVQFFAYFHPFEHDYLQGYSAEYDHQMGNDLISLAYDHTHSSTYSGVYESDSFDPLGYALSYTVPDGSNQSFGTWLLRGIFNAGSKLDFTLSNYLNTYRSTYPVDCVGGCPRFAGSTPVQFVFTTSNHTHYDGRLGVSYRLNSDVALRFAAGSSIAPPYLYILSRLPQGTPSYNNTGHFGIQTVNAGNLQPETAFGYNLGADIRSRSNIDTLSADLYSTTLFNQYIQQTFPIGLCTPSGRVCIPSTTGTVPLLGTGYVNLTNARYQGFELTYHHEPAFGFGLTIQGALQRAYPFNISPCFYIAGPCTGSPNTNLSVIPNINFLSGVEGTNGVSNQNIPYAQAYGELNYRFSNDIFLRYGETLYGNNNSYNQPAFWVADASARFPLQKDTAFQVSAYNLFNTHNGLFPVLGEGVSQPLANGQIGLTQANVIGPRRVTLMYLQNFGHP
ncbi:MAG: TonB-dependent receptor [Candidatus Eremiobacteraeota bacterium]|nr:TonB-dependent receptor [Candidatus Eremiobacteraeota bacterium]